LGHKDFLIFTDFLDLHYIPYTVVCIFSHFFKLIIGRSNNHSISFFCPQVIQKQGQFVFLEPNAAHFGFNCGHNIAEAVNFASESWINHGLYAPICGDMYVDEETTHNRH
jgi:hypothetical protein